MSAAMLIPSFSSGVTTAQAAVGKVTSYEKVNYDGMQNGKFAVTVENNHTYTAFCGNHSKSTPPVNTPLTNRWESNDMNLKKVLWYGYKGPKSVTDSWSDSKAWTYTNQAVSYALGNGSARKEFSNWAQEVYTWEDVPSGFHVYVCDTTGSYQPMVYWTYDATPPGGWVQIFKRSTDWGMSGNVDFYALAGAGYAFWNENGDYVGTIYTNDDGWAISVRLNVGTYAVKEVSAPKGFQLDPQTHYVTVYDNQVSTVYSDEVPGSGYVAVQKKSSDPALTNGNSCYSLEGAVYGVYSGSNQVATLTTDANGYARSGALPLGNYTVKEISAPKGFAIDAKGYNVTVTAGGTATAESTDTPVGDPAGIEIFKVDAESGEKAQGSATLAGAEFTLKYYETLDYNSIDELNAANVQPTRTWVLKTQEATTSSGETVYLAGLSKTYKVSGDDFFYKDGRPFLPLGTLVIEETKAPDGYTLDNMYLQACDENGNATGDKVNGAYFTKIAQEGDSAKVNGGNYYTASDYVKRGDILFVKRNGDTEKPMANIPFKITSKTTGESHVIYTDENGYYSTSASYIKHSYDTNSGKAGAGLWFGADAVDDSRGALPYDTYTVEEQKCDANKGMRLVSFDVTVSKDNYTIDLETIRNYSYGIGTSATDAATDTQYALAEKDASIIDAVDYWGLERETDYTLVTTLMDKSTKEPVKDANGNAVTKTTTFRTKGRDGTQKVEIDFDASSLAGKDVVVFQKLYESASVDESKLLCTEEDIDNADQTIHFPSVGTKAAAKDTNANVSNAGKKVTITDTVSVKNVQVGKTYDVVGKLYDKETGKPVTDADGKEITSTVKYKAEKANGTVEVTFTFDASLLAGKTVVCFEDLIYKGKTLGVHADITDEGQSVHFPKVATTALDSVTKEHAALAGSKVTITDTLKYENLDTAYAYKVKGTVYDLSTKKPLKVNGKEVTATGTIQSAQADGSYDMNFTFDASGLAGKTIYIVEEVTYKDVVVAEHNDASDTLQQIQFPKIGTTAKAADSNGNITKAGTIKITDTVKYENVVPGQEYTVNGTLLDRSTGKAVLDDSGKAVTSSVTITPEKANGSVDVVFEFNGANAAGTVTVVKEELTRNGNVYAVHDDLTDKDQTVYIPSIGTTALDAATDDHESMADSNVTINDTVEYKALVPGKTYTVTGKLYDKETGKPVLDKNGKEITSSKEFTAETSDGSVVVTFTFDGSLMAGKTVVAEESLTYEGKEYAVHADINDTAQTVKFPSIETHARDFTTDEQASFAGKDLTVVDRISLKNLTVGNSYTLKGVVYDKETGKPLEINGKQVTVTKKFEAVMADSTEEMQFEFDGTGLEGKTLVIYETLTNGKGVKVAEEADINSKTQDIHIPQIKTTVEDSDSKTNVSQADDEVTLVDHVEYKNLLTDGRHYTLKGTLMDQKTGEAVLDDNGAPITATTEFVPETADGSVDVTFTFKGRNLKGSTAVVFETLIRNDKTYAVHTDIDDESQTEYFPEIKTTALDSETGKHISEGDDAKIIDKVSYTDLKPGETYELTGYLMYSRVTSASADGNTADSALETGFVKDADGNNVTSTVKFVAKETSGFVDVEFDFDASSYKGATLTAMQQLKVNGSVVATHEDLNAEEQQIHVPKIGTQASDSASGTNVSNSDNTVTIKDTVSYENLIPGLEYVMNGVVIDKSTGKPFKDDAGKEVRKTVTFTPETADGSIEMEFTFDAKSLGSKTLVAYENCTLDGIEVAIHADLNSPEQTVYLPKIDTTALDSESKAHISYADDSVTINDTVDFTDIAPGQEYRLDTSVVDAETGKVIEVDGKALQSSMNFTPDKADYTVNVPITFNGSGLEGKTLVVFQRLYLGDFLVSVHEDINDADQQVQLPKIGTTATSQETGLNQAFAEGTAHIKDTVAYENLIPGSSYVVEGIVMDAETGEALKVDGKEVTASATFKPEEKNGSVDVDFEFDAEGLEGHDAVIFEKVYITDAEKVLVASHEDLKDAGQTIKFVNVEIGTTAKDKETGNNTVTAGKVTIVDTVAYKNLIPGLTYTVYGTAMDPETGKALVVDGKEVTASTEFTPTEADGTVDVEFEFDASGLAGKKIVFFEQLKFGEVLIASHADLNDEAQTITVVEPDHPETVKTNDASRMGVYAVLAVIAAGAIVGVAFYSKRRKES